MKVPWQVRYKRLREEQGLTQVAVATACSVSEAAVSAWEKSVDGGMKAETLIRLASLLKVDPGWLLTGKPLGFGRAPGVAASPLEEVSAALMLILPQLTETQQTNLLRTARLMALENIDVLVSFCAPPIPGEAHRPQD